MLPSTTSEAGDIGVVGMWTGAGARALRLTLRLTIEEFAKGLGVVPRTVSNWESSPDLVPTLELQRALDVVLQQATREDRVRFRLLLAAKDAGQPANTSQKAASGRGASSLSYGGSTDRVSSPEGERVQVLGRQLLGLHESHGLSEDEVQELAGLAGNVVELTETIDINIEADGRAAIVYWFDLLNLTERPLSRVARDIWFQCVEGDALAIEATPGGDRHVVIQRIHDTADMSKFAFQISPPLQTGETAHVGYSCRGGRFDVLHYWRQLFPRHTKRLTMRIRQKGIRLAGCTATEERPDGSELSAADTLTWDYADDDVIMTLTRDHLRPNQSVTMRWEVIRGAPG